MADHEIARVKFPLEVVADIEFDAEDLVSKLSTLQVADLIVELDNEVGDWEHSLLLYHHFSKQYEILKKKMPELAGMTEEDLRKSLELDEASDACE